MLKLFTANVHKLLKIFTAIHNDTKLHNAANYKEYRRVNHGILCKCYACFFKTILRYIWF